MLQHIEWSNMKLFAIIGIVVISDYKVSCEFKCRTEGCVTQAALNGKFGSYFKGQEHAPCLKFSNPENLVRYKFLNGSKF